MYQLLIVDARTSGSGWNPFHAELERNEYRDLWNCHERSGGAEGILKKIY